MKEINEISSAVRQVKSNDKRGMSFLYTTFVKEMLTLAYRVTNNLSDAEDVVQESFVKSFQKIEQLKEPENYKYWLKRIVVNHSIRVSKKRIHFAQVEEGQIKAEEEAEDWYAGIDLGMIKGSDSKFAEWLSRNIDAVFVGGV